MKYITIIILFFFCNITFANQDTNFCANYELDDISRSVLPELANFSIDIVDRFCQLENHGTRNLNSDILELAKRANETFKSIGLSETLFPFGAEITRLEGIVSQGRNIINISAPVAVDPIRPGLNFDGNVMVTDVRQCDNIISQLGLQQSINCKKYIDAFITIYEHAQKILQKVDTDGVRKFLTINKAAWNNYFEKSRYQTIVERFINGRLWAKNKKPGSFLEPPRSQIIFLRPSPVIENVSEAIDGNETEEALMVEIVGINYWRRDKWYQLSGASAVSVFSDRAGISDWGRGVAFHFGNKLTLGAVKHSDDTGYFITVDVLEFLKDKRKLISSHLDKVKSN